MVFTCRQSTPVLAAWGRFCSPAPVGTLTLIVLLYASTFWSGWLEPIGMVLLLIVSYLVTIFRGPGFVPRAWTPSADEIARLAEPAETLPLDTKPPIRDLLQFCERCNGFKPPRAHHCSSCGRCVLWMDHHCPWTNTCIGYRNLKSFVLFVHYVTLACVHSFAIQSEAVIRLTLLLYRNRRRNFWKYLAQVHTAVALVSWVADLVIMLLVGSLAWDMHWSLAGNITMVEELIVDKADMRRGHYGEHGFVYPYDLGTHGNWELVMGRKRLWWLCPVPPQSDGHWPPLREGSGPFDLSTEQLAQKAYKLSKSVVMPVVRAHAISQRCSCCLSSWCRTACQFGCGTACDGPPCGEPLLTVRPGDWVLVSQREEQWLLGRALAAGLEGPEGWIPRACVNVEECKKYEVPHQRQLQGEWLTATGQTVRVSGAIVAVVARHVPHVLRAEGTTTTLLGCQLRECDGSTARWSSGDVWRRSAFPEAHRSSGDRGPAWQQAEAKKDV
mmetsp:Transcript_143832/g.400880  ORF Transcript_143832/g.400880 Transcript_143832/m.400880 type:complete len:498 (+) Transcript_143832:56-1549(+)